MVHDDDALFEQSVQWFQSFQRRLCDSLEAVERDAPKPSDMGAFLLHPTDGDQAATFEKTPWQRGSDDAQAVSRPAGSAPTQADGGGGVMALMREGRVFEKAGVNFSCVQGTFSDAFRQSVPGTEDNPRFKAAGVSVVVHPRSPLVPAAHMNVRIIRTTHSWFGGGGDLTPVFPDDADTARFHKAYKDACNKYNSDYYPDFKKQCDDYFWLPHRNESRGVGGIFFDYLNTEDKVADFAFVCDVADAFDTVYPAIVRGCFDKSWDKVQKNAQRVKRGRYVEFNLLYDRGTLFGLKTGGNTDAILMSLPPDVAWP